MQFNPSKCEFVAVTNKKLTPSFIYHINNVPIKTVQPAKYLGGLKVNMKGTYQDNYTQSKRSTCILMS